MSRARRAALSGIAAGLLAVSLACGGKDLASDGGLELILEPGSTRAVEVLQDRLDLAGETATVALEGSQIAVQVVGPEDPAEVVALVTRRGQFTIHEVSDRYSAEQIHDIGEAVARGAEPRSLALDPGDLWYEGDPPLILRPHVMDNSDVVGVRAEETYDGRLALMMTFSASGKGRFADLTTRVVGRQVALVVDGRVATAPYVREPIVGGMAQLDMVDEQSTRVMQLVFSTSPLPDQLTLVSETVIGPTR